MDMSMGVALAAGLLALGGLAERVLRSDSLRQELRSHEERIKGLEDRERDSVANAAEHRTQVMSRLTELGAKLPRRGG